MSELDLTDAIEAGARAVAKLAGDNWDRIDLQWNNGKAELVRAAYRRRARMVLEAAAPLIVADTRRKVAEELRPVLIAHQRMDRGGCLCGWNELGRSHPAHIIAVWQDVARGSGGDEMATHDTPISEETK